MSARSTDRAAMGETFFEVLDEGPFVIADGAMGTNLMARGLEAGDAPELWNLEHVKRLSILTRDRRAKLTPLSGTAEVVPVVNRGDHARLRVAPCATRSEAARGVPVDPPGQPGRRHGRRRLRSGS